MGQDDMSDKIDRFSAEHPGARFFLNMSNGLEAAPLMDEKGLDYRLCYLMSSHLECSDWNLFLSRLDAEFMMLLALGNEVAVVDYGANKDFSKATYLGVPFIKYCLERCWYGTYPDHVRIKPRKENANTICAATTFDEQYRNLDRKTKKWMKKFRQYAQEHGNGEVRLHGISVSTVNDGNKEYYVDIAGRSKFCADRVSA